MNLFPRRSADSFQPALREFVIADPKLLADAFKAIVTFALVLPQGRLLKADLTRNWSAAGFSLSLQDFLAALLIRFNVFFPWKDGSSKLR